MHYLASNIEFIDLWNRLIRYSKRYKISHEDLEDIVSESIIKALEYYDKDRGSFESLCLVIIKNKIFNFTSQNKFLFLLVLIDDAGDIIELDTETFEDKEQNIMALKFIDKLMKRLDEDELKLFKALYGLCESSKKPNISKASRLIGIEPRKGWDIFRRIQRKAEIKKYDDIAEDISAEYFDIPNDYVESGSVIESKIYSKSEFYNESFEIKIDAGFEKFINSLSKDNLSKLEKIYED